MHLHIGAHAQYKAYLLIVKKRFSFTSKIIWHYNARAFLHQDAHDCFSLSGVIQRIVFLVRRLSVIVWWIFSPSRHHLPPWIPWILIRWSSHYQRRRRRWFCLRLQPLSLGLVPPLRLVFSRPGQFTLISSRSPFAIRGRTWNIWFTWPLLRFATMLFSLTLIH